MASNEAAEVKEEEEEREDATMAKLGSYGGEVRLVVDGEESAAEEIMLLWGIQQPTLSKPNSFVSQSSLKLSIDSCGHSLSILQSPSSLGTPGVTGSVMWDSGVVLGKFLEHSVDSGVLVLQGKKIVELGSGCGLVGTMISCVDSCLETSEVSIFRIVLTQFIIVHCSYFVFLSCIAALLGGEVILTDLPDRLRLLRKNIETNMKQFCLRGSVTATELIWGDDADPELVKPMPDYVLGSDVVYSEGAVEDLLETLGQLCGPNTTIFLAGELRNDAILEYFLEAAMNNFRIGRVDQNLWHPDYRSNRVVLYVLVKK
ncbi:hypothetical protein Ahy_B05g074309 isoform A [Arachis hypogaea]|uniref:Protein N-lysine methyltransferase METTL21A n=1 Tax=Arachis hypogaea TaxID=3818 RepID=A0A444YYI2_ARAHY|nr:hypothetical protein Ahy_B05g074309 isoform A [Arachis hypogaea]